VLTLSRQESACKCMFCVVYSGLLCHSALHVPILRAVHLSSVLFPREWRQVSEWKLQAISYYYDLIVHFASTAYLLGIFGTLIFTHLCKIVQLAVKVLTEKELKGDIRDKDE